MISVGMDQNWIAKKHGTVSNTENDHKDPMSGI
jgi:hypothetical protein